MKKLYIILFLITVCRLAYAQTEAALFKKTNLANKDLIHAELKGQFLQNYDFSKLWTETDNSIVYGFIGNNYQRIRIKFITVTKDSTSSDTYLVYGKSMVKNNVDEFKGTIKIANIRKLIHQSFGIDEEFKNKGLKGDFVIIGDYSFSENEEQNHSGVFKGTFQTKFYLDKNSKIHYDDLDLGDSYNNNQFVGIWTEYKTNLIKRCNWGDYRIPNSGDFDIGAGDFSPSKGDGWQSIQAGWNTTDKKTQAKAKAIEKAKWWK